MDEIADTIKKTTQIKKIRIEGHASADGSHTWNKQLSAGRAKAVMKALVDRGVPSSELVAVGYGDEKPIADNDTEQGREQNRRVEFTILDDNTSQASNP